MEIQAVSSASYYEYGTVKLADIKNGRLVITDAEEASVGTIYLSATDDAYDDIIIASMNDSALPEIIQRENVTNPASASEKKLVVTIQQVNAEGKEDISKTEKIYLYGANTAYEETKKYTGVSELGSLALEAVSGTSSAVSDNNADKYVGKDNTATKEEAKSNTLFASGAGTKDSPWGISCVDEWNEMNKKISETGSEYYFVVVKDFGFDADHPIDNACLIGKTVSFHLDGDNHTVSNINAMTGKYKNLFGSQAEKVNVNDITFNYTLDGGDSSFIYDSTSTGEVKFTNVTITGYIKTSTTSDWQSPFIQYPGGNVYYTNCTNYANMTGGVEGPFGVAAYSTGKIYFDNCANYGTITGVSSAGFIASGNGQCPTCYFADENSVRNYGDIYGSSSAGHFYATTSGTTFTDSNSLVVTVAQEGSYAATYSTFTTTAPTNYGDSLIINEVSGAASYSVSVTAWFYQYNYPGNANVWGGGFNMSMQREYSSSDIVDGKLTTEFKKLYACEPSETKYDYQTGEVVSYTALSYANHNDSNIYVAAGDNEFVSIAKDANKEYYYCHWTNRAGLISSSMTDSSNVTITFNIYAYNEAGKIIKTSTCSYTYKLSDAKAYFGN